MLTRFMLPGGLLEADGACAREGRLRPMNGFDEEWIHALSPTTSRAALVTGLIARCVKRIGSRRVTRAVARELTMGDRDYLMLKLYQATFGAHIALVPICDPVSGGCGARMDLNLRLDDLPVEERPVQPTYRVLLDGQEPVEIELRLPRGADQEALAAAASGAEPARELRRRLLDACVVSERPPATDDDALEAAIERCAPRVELEIGLRCPECGHQFDFDLDLVALLLQNVGQGRKAFDREIHLLAFHYHWPLRELFGLTWTRRRRFLRVLVDELAAQGS